MQWKELKSRLLAAGSVQLTGEPAEQFIAKSAAGPGAGGSGAIFFAMGSHRVKLAVNPLSTIEVAHRGNGTADLYFDGKLIGGRLLEPGFHCPGQAFITVTADCVFSCRVLLRAENWRQAKVRGGDRGNGGISPAPDPCHLDNQRREGKYRRGRSICARGRKASCIFLPSDRRINISDRKDADLLHELGVAEVKFNLEAATPELFAAMCPGLDYTLLWHVLDRSVALFGRNRVFSNVIIGLGETDTELETCIRKLTAHGVIPVLRPLNPVADLAGTPRPSAERLKTAYAVHESALAAAGLDARLALTMCTNCAGCDLVPGREE